MKKLFFALLACVACGGPPVAARPATLPQANGHAPTLAERKAQLCGKRDLVPLVASVPSEAESPAETGVVKDVTVRDAHGAAVDVSAETIAPLAVGSALDARGAQEAERRLWKTGKFDDVALETSPAPGGVHVVLRVTPKRTIAHVFVDGDTDDGDLAALRLAPGAVYDPVALFSARRNLVESYRDKGNLDADVMLASAFGDLAHTGVDVCLAIVRGERVTLDGIRVHGSAHDAALEAMLAKEDPKNVPGAIVARDYLDRDDLLVSAYLYDQGLIESKVERSIQRHGDHQTIEFTVTDGPVYRYGRLDVRGDLAAPKARYRKLITLKPGAVFSRTETMKVLEAIRLFDEQQGRPDLDVEPETELDSKKGTVALVFALHGTPGFTIVELARGAGRAATKGDHVTVRYTGKLKDGTVFDTNVGKDPFAFEIGAGTVIGGFERGVLGMQVGGKRRVTIPPDMGYGSRGWPPKIPPSSTLVYEIEMLSIQ